MAALFLQAIAVITVTVALALLVLLIAIAWRDFIHEGRNRR